MFHAWQNSQRPLALGGGSRARRLAAHRQHSATPCAADADSFMHARISLSRHFLCTRSQSSTIVPCVIHACWPVTICATLTASHLGSTASWLAAQPGFGINALVRLGPLVTGGVSARLEEVRSNSFGAEKMLARTITKFLAKVLIGPSRCSTTHTQRRVVSVVRGPGL